MLRAAVPRPRPRLIAALVLVALAAGLTACGNKEDDGHRGEDRGHLPRRRGPAPTRSRSRASSTRARPMTGPTSRASRPRSRALADAGVRSASSCASGTRATPRTRRPRTSRSSTRSASASRRSRCRRHQPVRLPARPLEPGGTIPLRERGRLPGRRSSGSVLLFKVDIASYLNRPLEFAHQVARRRPRGHRRPRRLGAAQRACLAGRREHAARRRRRGVAAGAGAHEQHADRDARPAGRARRRRTRRRCRRVGHVLQRSWRPPATSSGLRPSSSSSAVPVLPATVTPGIAAAVPVPPRDDGEHQPLHRSRGPAAE